MNRISSEFISSFRSLNTQTVNLFIMNTNKFTFSALLLCSVLMLGACHKKSVNPSDDTGSETTTAQDAANYSSASNQSAEEAETAFSGSPSTARTTSASGQSILGVTSIPLIKRIVHLY
jgi:hypothetical protein